MYQSHRFLKALGILDIIQRIKEADESNVLLTIAEHAGRLFLDDMWKSAPVNLQFIDGREVTSGMPPIDFLLSLEKVGEAAARAAGSPAAQEPAAPAGGGARPAGGAAAAAAAVATRPAIMWADRAEVSAARAEVSEARAEFSAARASISAARADR
ncbi:uncharacterized protein E0L32_012295 [Thyridium curvatum]|uniref:Uncharacterized protein n=1 Tax=Thyridium curvatum TaxID=1093900 RepID=A0A507BK13_9PEZI|nr:uncharacterized protein E0L32_012295 [Thyridium curvatum]TPX17038.1 hypothetical protein E0L32_012295 [Thyridium curvatum]